ncbi:MAG TPA: stage II sporulation protein P [Candidatus Aphodoplasma excrementigallinarum]|uniref:Stage II sporulation protein P n=1 Tax=Candidatus Aphodoplasma excrementigallinarum TaxID=2840673 RepID=A0A9D1SZX0_9FIRM|nr:stage II sporulation protein P [Candidatus Aphodoplasma excrementigallinarum]
MCKNGSMRKFKTIVVDKSSLYTALAILSSAALLVYGAIACAGFLFSHLSITDEENLLARASLESAIPALGDSGARQTLAKKAANALLGFDISDPKTILYSQIGGLKIANAQAADAQTAKNAQAESTPAPSPTPAAEDDGERYPIVETSSVVGGIANTGTNKSLYVNNETSFDIDINSLLNEPLAIQKQDGPLVLIVHTHTTESYTPSGQYSYSPEESTRTQDKNFNVVRVGDGIAAELQAAGINVIHDTSINDYPSYNGSYKKTLGVIESYLAQYPSIQVVLDVHRDGMTSADGTKYKVTADIGGEKAAQVMVLCGSSEGGLSHPDWLENLKLGLRIQDVLTTDYEGLARPLHLVKERYNQHATKGSMILEVGTDGNTLDEALVTAKYVGRAIAKVLNSL